MVKNNNGTDCRPSSSSLPWWTAIKEEQVLQCTKLKRSSSITHGRHLHKFPSWQWNKLHRVRIRTWESSECPLRSGTIYDHYITPLVRWWSTAKVGVQLLSWCVAGTGFPIPTEDSILICTNPWPAYKDAYTVSEIELNVAVGWKFT